MIFVLRTVLAVTAGGIIALTLNANARPVPAAIPILVAALVFAAIALLAIESSKGRGDDEDEAPPEEAKPPPGGEVVFDRPIKVSGRITSMSRPSAGVSRVLPGIGEKVKVTLIEAGVRRTIYMEFGARWAGALGEFHLGDFLEGSGWLKKTTAHSVHLVDCALAGHGSAQWPASMAPRRQTERLTKSYGSARGIEGVTITVEAGEVFGFSALLHPTSRPADQVYGP